MIHPEDCECTESYGCQLRRKGLQVAPSATPNRHNRHAPAKQEPPNYNKQVMGEHRPGGTFMPYLNPDATPIRRKQWENKGTALTESLHRLRRGELAERASHG